MREPRAATLFTVWEEVGPTPDEGYDRFAADLTRALGRRRKVVYRATPPPRCARPLLPAVRLLAILRIAIAIRFSARRSLILYGWRNPVTIPGLLRAHALRVVAGAPVVVAVLVPNRASRLAMGALARFPPDRLLLSSGADLARAAERGIPASLISTGVDPERFRPASQAEKLALRRRHGVPEDRPVVLHVGHLRSSRGLHALEPIAADPGLTLLVVVSNRRGPRWEAIRQELQERGARVVGGYQPAVEELYRLSDCYVFPGATDGAVSLPLSILEALACGLPVVTVPYEAVRDQLAGVPGVTQVDALGELPAAVRAALSAGAARPALPARLSLSGAADTVSLAVDAVAGAPRTGTRRRVSSRLRLSIRRVIRHQAARLRLWAHLAVEPEPRRLRPLSVSLAGGHRSDPRTASARRPAAVLLGDPRSSAAGRCAALLGVEAAGGRAPLATLRRALEEHWPLVVWQPAARRLSEAAAGLLAAYVRGGGTLYVEDLGAAPAERLQVASRALRLSIPVPAPPAAVESLVIGAGRDALCPELAGARIGISGAEASFAPAAGWAPLLEVEGAGARRAAVLQCHTGGGRVIASALRGAIDGRIGDSLYPEAAAAVLPPLMLARREYGVSAWHPPAVLANFTIDDPALVEGRFGLPFRALARAATETGIHITAATIPAELREADPAVVALLRGGARSLSACYHGCHHRGYEFWIGRDGTAGERRRARQLALLEESAALGEAFTRRHGLALDRVMVFPRGIGPHYLLPELERLGFLASCNYPNRLPLGTEAPPAEDLGARPADVAWHGFPLLWRRPLEDGDWICDLLLGRPLLMFGHRNLLAGAPDVLLDRASEVASAAPCVLWRGLEEVARHAYLQRLRPDGGFDILMTANEACLHNPCPAPRRFRIERPGLGGGARIEVDGVAGCEVEVAGGATALARVVRHGSSRGPRLPVEPRPCSVFPATPP